VFERVIIFEVYRRGDQNIGHCISRMFSSNCSEIEIMRKFL
jgi:hypothetical protein